MLRHSAEVDLGGQWRFRLDPEGLGEHLPQQLDIPWQFDARWMNPEHDDREWADITVPAYWQAEGVDYNGVAWYRHALRNPLADTDFCRAWLSFDGVDYYADAWINGRYLGSHEGYFAAFQYEITRHLAAGQNLLAVRVDAPNDFSAKEVQTWQLKRMLKGALQRWDVNDPELNPGGIWNKVRLILAGPGAVTGLKVQSQIRRLPSGPDSSEPLEAMVLVGVRLAGFPNTASRSEALLRVTVEPANFEGGAQQVTVPVQPTPSDAEWQVPLTMEEARLWWPWDLGEPSLYRVQVSLEIDGRVSDSVVQTVGLRQVEQGAGWETYVNGHRIFQRGANYLSDHLLSSMTPERYRQDVKLLKGANLNIVHPFCVVEKQAFYDECDREGLLVYQDIPMWLEMDTGSDLVRRATNQMDEMVSQYGHHPSILVWNCGSQASVANFLKLGSALAQIARDMDPTRIVQQSNALVDLSGPERDVVGDFHWSAAQADEFVDKHDWRMDTHQYYGWYTRDLEYLRQIPTKYLELITEYGAQALPSRSMLESFVPADGLYPPHWPDYTKRCFQPEYQLRYIELPETLDGFITASQDYQAEFLQRHTEHYRRHKFAPCNGAHMFCFNDCWPAITWSVIDYQRQPKPGYFALQRAMAPLQIMIEFLDELVAGHVVRLLLCLVNDWPRSFDAVEVRWRIGRQGVATADFEGALPASIGSNDLRKVGQLTWRPEVPGEYVAKWHLVHDGGVVAENAYHLHVVPSDGGKGL